jgi:hypothetical protein
MRVGYRRMPSARHLQSARTLSPAKESLMPRLAVVLMVVISCVSCATRGQQDAAAAKRSVDAVVVDETARQKVVQAINAGDSPDRAMARVSSGPKNEKPVPN